ncbi:PepSY domain-containing protein [Aggregatilineales bacterium SYSU G02658]
MMRPHIWIYGAALLVAGVGVLQAFQPFALRPTPREGEVITLDERPVAFNAQFSLDFATTSETDMTLLTVVDPVISAQAAAIEPVANGLSIEQVMSLLAQARPEATIREIRVKREQGTTIYEVDFSDNFRLKLDATSGQMLSLDTISSSSPQPPPHRRVQGYTAATTLLSAVALAQERHPDAAFKDAKLEIHDGLLVYKVKFDRGVEAFIDANTGQHLFSRLPRGQYDTSSLPIQPEDVLPVVLAAHPNAAVRDWKVKFDKGTVVYEVKLTNHLELYISALTGDIFEVESHD